MGIVASTLARGLRRTLTGWNIRVAENHGNQQ